MPALYDSHFRHSDPDGDNNGSSRVEQNDPVAVARHALNYKGNSDSYMAYNVHGTYDKYASHQDPGL